MSYGAVDECLLAVDRVGSGAIWASGIRTVRPHVACFDLIGEVGVKDVAAEVVDQFGIAHGKNNLDSAVEVSRHQIGAAEIDLFLASISEIVDSTVFEEAADDAGYFNVFAYALNPRTQAADPSH